MASKKQDKSDTTSVDKPISISYFDRLNHLLEPRLELIFRICFVLTTIMGIVFFDPKVSIGGDDSMYVNRAFNFIHKGTFPTFQGPFYPMFLGGIIYVAGLKLMVLKSFSLLFILGHIYFFYKSLKKHLAPFLLVCVLIILSINATFLYYASTTYSEPLFLFLQGLFVYLIDKYLISTDASEKSMRSNVMHLVILAGLSYIMYLTRSIGLSAFLATFLYFLIEALKKHTKKQNWVILGLFTAFFFGYHLSFKLVKTQVWDVNTSQVSGQLDGLLYKNYYNKSEGKENFSGFVQRFKTNSNYYLNHHTSRILGLKQTRELPKTYFLTFLLMAVLLTGFAFTIKTNPFWMCLGIYLVLACGIMFVILQVSWNQERLILAYFPLLLAGLFQSFDVIFNQKIKRLRLLTVLIPMLFIGSTAFQSLKAVPPSITALKHYVNGEKYYGFTPDWVNYLQMAEWSAKELPASTLVACRKPGMAFIYSEGKEFYGIWRVPSEDPDDLYKRLKDAGVTHVIMANLRVTPDRVTNRTINTVRRYLSYIHKAYPDKLEFVHKIGETESAFLYKLN